METSAKILKQVAANENKKRHIEREGSKKGTDGAVEKHAERKGSKLQAGTNKNERKRMRTNEQKRKRNATNGKDRTQRETEEIKATNEK